MSRLEEAPPASAHEDPAPRQARGDRPHRAFAAILALVVASAGFIFAVRAFRALDRTPTPPRSAVTVENGLIALSFGDPPRLHLVNPDGSGLRELTTGTEPDSRAEERGYFEEMSPTWSPDGARIAFIRWYDPGVSLCMIDADGTDFRIVVPDFRGGGLTWSPDGSTIAYARDGSIHLLDANGSNDRVLAGLPEAQADDPPNWQPTWSPDGARIAFTNRDLWTIGVDGTGLMRLTELSGESAAFQPTWSPDGRRIAFSLGRWLSEGVGGGQAGGEIYLVDADGSHLTQLVDDEREYWWPVWSPDGKLLIALGATPAGTGDPYGRLDEGTYVIDAASADVRSLADELGQPAWQPVPAIDESPTPEPTGSGTESGSSVSTVEIGHGGGIDLAIGEAAVWVTTRDAVVRVDPSGKVSTEIPVEEPFHIATGDGWVWVTAGYEGGDALVRIDPSTDQISMRILLPGAYCVDVSQEAVWVSTDSEIVRLDPVSGEVVARVAAEPGAEPASFGCLVVGPGGVWVVRSGDHDSLVRIDPVTNQIVGTVDLPNPGGWNEVVAEAGSLWLVTERHVRLDDGTQTNSVFVLQIDPATNEVVGDPIDVGYGMYGAGTGSGSIWVYDGFTDGISRIDPSSHSVVNVIPVLDGGSWGGDPGIAAGDGVLWMAGTVSLNRIDLS